MSPVHARLFETILATPRPSSLHRPISRTVYAFATTIHTTVSLCVSPSKDAEILKILAAGLGLTLNDAPFSEFRKVNVSEFGSRIRGIVIHRCLPTRPPDPTDCAALSAACRAMHNGCAHAAADGGSRYSEPPKESDAERTAKTMRSLPESERKLLEEKFSEIDTDYSGTLTYSEMGGANPHHGL